MFDVIIIWAGASGLFLWSILSEDLKKVILEKTDKCWSKLLLSWNGRCNFTNLNVNADKYIWENKDNLNHLFKECSPEKIIRYFKSNWIESKEEDNWRILLKSNKSKQLLDFLTEGNKKNNTEIVFNEEVLNIEKKWDYFCIKTNNNTRETKRIVIATWWKSFPQLGASDFVFSFCKKNNIKTKSPSPALCWIETKENLSSLSWSSIIADIEIKDEKMKNIYNNSWTVLFTHRWISWPVIFNTSLFLGYYYKNFNKLTIKLHIKNKNMTKRLFSFLWTKRKLDNYILTLHPTKLKERESAKVTSWWIYLEELSDNFELKKLPNIFIIWEALNITWETWWYNLHRARTSAYQCYKAIDPTGHELV